MLVYYDCKKVIIPYNEKYLKFTSKNNELDIETWHNLNLDDYDSEDIPNQTYKAFLDLYKLKMAEANTISTLTKFFDDRF